MKKYLTEREAAELIGKSVRTLQQWRYLKKGPKYHKDKHGGISYLEGDLDKFMGD